MAPGGRTRRAAWVIQIDLDRSRSAGMPIGTIETVATGRRRPISGWATLKTALAHEAGLPSPQETKDDR